MKIFIKSLPGTMKNCRATRIDYSLDGVLFEGYNIPCDESDARMLLEIARQYCPEIVSEIQKAMRFAESGG